MSKDKEKSGNWFKRHKILSGIGVLIVVGIIASAAGGSKTNTTSSNSSPNNPSATATTTEPKQSDVPAEYKSALAQAKTYNSTAHLSKKGLYDQLTSEYGGKFTAEAAQYAVDNVNADWNANALAQAKTYQNQLHLSPAAVRDQLVSDAGGKFEPAEADYAVQHLND